LIQIDDDKKKFRDDEKREKKEKKISPSTVYFPRLDKTIVSMEIKDSVQVKLEANKKNPFLKLNLT